MKSFILTLNNKWKYFCTFIVFLSSWFAGNSQYYHLNEDFETFPNTVNPFPFKGWSNVITAGNFTVDFWRFGNPGGRTVSSPAAGLVAIFDSDNYSNNGATEDISLTSPILDTRGYPSVWLKFDQQFESGAGGNWAVEAFDGATWYVVASGSNQINWRTDSIDITTYCANKENARVRFRWRGNWAFWWALDHVRVYSPVVPDNVTTVKAVMVGGQCGSTTDNISTTIRNVSDGSLSNIPVKAIVTGTIGGNPVSTIVSATVAGPLAPGQVALVNLGPIDTRLGGTLDYKAFTDLSGDPDRTNDTVTVTAYSIFGTPPLPVAPDVSRCGAGTVTLNGGILSGNTGYWYNSPSATNPLSSGDTYTTGLLMPPATETYYVTQARTSAPRTLGTGFPGGVWWTSGGVPIASGNMFTVTTLSNIVLDSIAVHINATSFEDISLYYKTGTYVGFESNASAWTLLDKVNVQARGAGNPTNVNVKDFNIPAGQTYSFYVQSSNAMLFSSGSNSVNNSDMVMTLGNSSPFLFSTQIINDFTWNGYFYYRIFCETNKVAVNAIAKPTASNSGFTSGTPFKGTMKTGDITAPDIVASPDNITYTILNPTGFSPATYGATKDWVITNIEFTTLNGTAVPTGDYLKTDPAGTTDGTFSYTPSSAYTDSTVRVRITIKRNDNLCDTVIERVIYVAPRPDPQFTISNGCENDFISLTNSSTLLKGTMTFFWDFGDGTTSSLAQPTKQYSVAGSYTVKLIVTSDLGYKDSLSKTVDIYQIPTANFNFVNACEGTAVSLTDNSVLPTGTPAFVWDYGDMSPAGSGAATSRLYAQPGIYYVTLKVTVNGCSSSASKYVTQAPRSVPDFTFPTAQCDNGSIAFDNGTTQPSFGSASFLWKFGDGNQSTDFEPTHTYNSFQAFDVVLVSNTDLGCADSIIKTVTLRESPAASYTQSAANCNNEPITFTNTSVIPSGSTNSYQWDFGDNITSTDASPTHQFSAPGVYKVILKTFSANGCNGELETFVTISLKPTAGFTSTDVCKGNATPFANSSYTSDNGTLTYLWKFGNGDSSIVTNPNVTYTTPGTYNVSLTTTHSNGCMDTKTNTVKVFEVPTVDIIPASANTGNGTINFATNSTGAGYTYHWQFGDGGSATTQNPTYIYFIDGSWTVTLTVSTPDGCSATTTQSVRVNRLGVDDIAGISNAITVYPNPSSGRFVLDLSKANTEIIEGINITDMLGRRVIENVAADAAGLGEIDLRTQAAGIYYLNIATQQGTHTLKLIVTR